MRFKEQMKLTHSYLQSTIQPQKVYSAVISATKQKGSRPTKGSVIQLERSRRGLP